jgi:hypothetical protein
MAVEYAFHGIILSFAGTRLTDFGEAGKIAFSHANATKYERKDSADGNPFYAFRRNNVIQVEITFMDKGDGFRVLNAHNMAYIGESENQEQHPQRTFYFYDKSEGTEIFCDFPVFTEGTALEYGVTNSEYSVKMDLPLALLSAVIAGASINGNNTGADAILQALARAGVVS